MDALVDAAEDQGWTPVRRHSDGWFVRLRHERHGLIDVIACEMPYQKVALGRARHEDLGDGTEIPVLAVEDIVILKLVAARWKDIDDIESILLSGKEIDWVYVRRWAEEWEVTSLLEQTISRAEESMREAEAVYADEGPGSATRADDAPSP